MNDYSQWQSNLTLEQVFAQGQSFSYPLPLGDGYLYLSALKDEGGRNVLMHNKTSDPAETPTCITPTPFNLRTKINEYGGKPYWVFGSLIYFANQSDQRLYKQKIDIQTGTVSSPKAVSPQTADQEYMFADITELNKHWLLSIVETSNDDHSCENTHSIGVFRHDSPQPEMVELAVGANFYSNLVVSADRSKVAWVQWDHPAMPWDETQLWVADISYESAQPCFVNQQKIDLQITGSVKAASVCQLMFANNGRLFFSVDFQLADSNDPKNYWNIMCYKFDDEVVQAVTNIHLEFGYPHWQYGDARIVQFDDNNILTFGTDIDGDKLYLIEQSTLTIKPLTHSSFTQKNLQNLAADSKGRTMAVMLSVDSNPSLISLELDDDQTLNTPLTVLSNSTVLNEADISVAEHFDYVTQDQINAHGYYYPPVNVNYKNDTAPPLIVMVHGGPTARAYGYFDIQKQYWTNHGFAVFDANPRGSTGYGRTYRDALQGQWGESDISDVVDGVEHLVSMGKADSDTVFIRGKSSGGYAVLCALTQYPDQFLAGACYYGIGNLVTLQEVTHKFEKYYTERLVGEQYDSATASLSQSQFFQRSPINQISQLQASMIIFQGMEDKIVPPSVAKEIVQALEDNDLTYSYIEYAEEGHGFKQVKNNIDALGRELAFYQSVLSKRNI